MSVGIKTANRGWSSIKYDGSPITSRFVATTENQQMIQFLSKNNKQISCNSVTIEADDVDLYFTIWVENSKQDPNTYDYTDSPVYHCPAGKTISINGLGIGAIKFANNLGANYFIQALS